MAILSVYGDCDEKSKDDSDVTAWFKNLGCHIKKGAEDLQESAKPWAEKIAANAKEFGHTVAQKYDEVKHKLTDEDKSTESALKAIPLNIPTEKVPLAPLPSAAAITSDKGEHSSLPVFPKATVQSDNENYRPEAIDQRFILQPYKCRSDEVIDHTGKCRKP